MIVSKRFEVQALIACLEKDTDGHVRAAAAIALGQLKDRQAAVRLLKALDDSGGAGVPASQALKSILDDEYTISCSTRRANRIPRFARVLCSNWVKSSKSVSIARRNVNGRGVNMNLRPQSGHFTETA